jgi:hypothetical protein
LVVAPGNCNGFSGSVTVYDLSDIVLILDSAIDTVSVMPSPSENEIAGVLVVTLGIG